MNNFGEKVAFCWSVADLLRDAFKRSKYPDVILPLTVLRRLDCVLEPTRAQVQATYTRLKDKLENLAPQLRKASGFAFFNTSPYNFERLLGDAPQLAKNLRAYINGFSDNMREVVEKFDFDNTISKLDDAGLLFLVLERFKNIDLHPDKVSNLEMGYIFEELIRKFNEAMDENPGEHFTPREVIRLMVNLLLTRDREALKQSHIVRTVYDCCCGSGGMLTIAKERIQEINPKADVHLFGQEVNPETFAVCKSDLFMKSDDGRDAENIMFGSTLGNDRHADQQFDYLLTNPPFGKEWKMDQKAVEAEHERGYAGRFGPGLPRISDGQLLFLQHLLNRMKDAKEGGSRVAIVMNGSPLFTGDAGSGESEIRRWILENDWLEAIVALPEQLFYNTGIPTYVWLLTNRKPKARKGKVQLIDARSIWTPMRRSLGEKRREITADHISEIVRMYEAFREAENCRIFATAAFGFRKITVERPLRLNFQASPERIERVRTDRAFIGLVTSKKKGEAGQREIEAGKAIQQNVLLALADLDGSRVWKNREEFAKLVRSSLLGCGVKAPASLFRSLLAALSERDETAEICTDEEGRPEPDPELRDTENVPLTEDVLAFFDREVKPHVPDAWISMTVRDQQDKEVGKVGYEINFNRYFYPVEPIRKLNEISADFDALERDFNLMLRQIRERIVFIIQAVTQGISPLPITRPTGLEWAPQIPSHWSVRRNVFLFSDRDERNYPELPILEVSMHAGVTVRQFSTEHVEQKAEDPATYKRALKGDLVFNKMRMWQGAVGVAPVDGLVSPDYQVCRPLSGVYSRYYELLFRTPFYKVEIYRNSHGIVLDRNRLYWDQFKQMPSLLPPYDEQREIVSYIDDLTLQTNAFVERILGDVESLREFRHALVCAAVTGKIDVRQEVAS